MQQQQTPLKLYSYCYSSATWRVRTVLNLKKLNYEIIPIDLSKDEQKSPEYAKINPNKTVPSLANEQGQIINDSIAIIEYLEEVYPQNTVYPVDLVEKAQVRAFVQVVNSFMQPMQTLKVMKRIETEFGGDNLKWIIEWMDQGFQTLETKIQENKNQGKYCFGDIITLADVYLYPQVVGSIRRFNYNFDSYPNIKRVMENLYKIKEFQDAEPKNQPDFPKE